MKFNEFFDRVYIINLPERSDRLKQISGEIGRLGLVVDGKHVQVPFAPRPDSENGFPSRGVYGNFLSHLSILKNALAEGMGHVLILEDDAIFSNWLVRNQDSLVEFLSNSKWDLCYFGHSLSREAKRGVKGLVTYTGPFYMAHCYAVNLAILPELIDYLEQSMELQPGDPRGARMYIDAAFTLFRASHPSVITLVGNPSLVAQRGSPSSIAGTGWYSSFPLVRPLVRCARHLRDGLWRLSV